MKESPSVSVLVLFGTGSKYETKKNNGISHFLEHMFFKGTKKRPTTLAISETLDRVGGEFNAFTSEEFTGYWAKVAYEQIDLALDWLSDVLINSQFPAAEIAREKGVIIEEINMHLDAPARYVGSLWQELLYGDQPAGRDVLGTKENIRAMKRSDFQDYFKTHYRAGNAVVCVAGQFDKDIEEKVKRYFDALAAGPASPMAKVIEKQDQPAIKIHYKKTDQTHLCLGVRAYDIFHPDRYVLAVLAAILGGMMSSRLFIAVRERKGLAYYVRTQAENFKDSGYLVTQAGVANERLAEAVTEILKEYRRARDQRIGAAEIKKAQDKLIGALRLSLETSDEVGFWLGLQEVLRNEVLTPEQVYDKIRAVKVADLARVARDIFQPKKLNLALIGPFKAKHEPEFKKLLKL